MFSFLIYNLDVDVGASEIKSFVTTFRLSDNESMLEHGDELNLKSFSSKEFLLFIY